MKATSAAQSALPMLAETPRSQAPRQPGLLTRLTSRHPEWWVVGLSACAWGLMLWHAGIHRGCAHHAGSFGEELASWLAMVAAMMLPLEVPTLRGVVYRSLATRRHRAMAGFVVGYLLPWLALGLLASAARPWLARYSAGAATVAFAAAAPWTFSGTYARALMGCHTRRPIAPLGWRADRDCVSFGLLIGAYCLAGGWAMMLGCALSGHGLLPMLLCAVLGGLEKGWYVRRPAGWVRRGAAVLAAGYLCVALTGAWPG